MQTQNTDKCSFGTCQNMMCDYFKKLYQRTMTQAYGLALREIADSLKHGGQCLDCGAGAGASYQRLRESLQFDPSRYHGIEWNAACVEKAKGSGFNVIQGDLNKPLPHADGRFRCVFGLSVLEHLLNGCAFMRECYRVLEKEGRLILLTPNISTFFTMALLLAGKMPSSGPHPDSKVLLAEGEIFKVSSDALVPDAECKTPMHRHLVVFSFRVLRRYLSMIGFTSVQGHGFGLYPFPVFMQPVLERIDPFHCHQMVFVARK